MRNAIKLLSVIMLLVIFLAGCSQPEVKAIEGEVTAQWARTTSGTRSSSYRSAVVDSSGSIYVAGSIYGTESYDFGNGVTAVGSSDGNNALLVKYNSSGKAQWTKTTLSSSDSSGYHSVAVDHSGNIYAVGCIEGNAVYDFGNGVTATGFSEFDNIILVKYDKNGNTQWARTVTSGTGSSYYNSVAVNSSGDIYTVGSIANTTGYNFGNNVTVNGTRGILLVKYDKNGNALWARTTISDSYDSIYNSVTVDLNGNIYTAGYIDGDIIYDFGNNVTLTGSSGNPNVLLVKYNSLGDAQWARTVTSITPGSCFNSVAVDPTGNIYTSGIISGEVIYDFGNNVSINKSSWSDDILLVKYNSSGDAQWARTANSGGEFYSVSVDSRGNIYASGRMFIIKNIICDFGNNINVTVPNSNQYYGGVVLVKYNSSGNAQWARISESYPDSAHYTSVAVGSSGSVYAAGFIMGTGIYDFGNGVTAGGSSESMNALLVKYH